MPRLLAAPAAAFALALSMGPIAPGASVLFGSPRAAFAQSAADMQAETQGPVQVESNTAQVDFGAEIRFQLRVMSSEAIRSVLFLYRVDDSSVENTGVPTYQPGTALTATYDWRVANVLVPGAEVNYQWQVETASGARVTTQEKTVTYNDTRFNWHEVQGDQVTVYFHSADPQLGMTLLDEVSKTQTRLSREYGLTVERPLKIFAYTRQQDYVSALSTGRPLDVTMTVGVDRIFVLAAGDTSAMPAALQGLRREVANAIFLQKTRNPYADPPRWLAEGFGLFVGGSEISAQSYRVLAQLAQANRLLPLKTLNGNFPNDERDRTLAYAESLSVVTFIAETYGPNRMRSLLAAFKEGNTVDDALKKGLGVSVDQLETRWKNTLKRGPANRPGAAERSSRTSPPADDGGLANRLFGRAISFWQGILGAYTVPVLIGIASFIGIGLVAIVASAGVSFWRRARAED